VRPRPAGGDQKSPEPTTPVVNRSPVIRRTTAVAENNETPPPLPEKVAATLAEPQADYANVGGSRHSQNDNVPPPVMRRTTHRGRVCVLLLYRY